MVVLSIFQIFSSSSSYSTRRATGADREADQNLVPKSKNEVEKRLQRYTKIVDLHTNTLI